MCCHNQYVVISNVGTEAHIVRKDAASRYIGLGLATQHPLHSDTLVLHRSRSGHGRQSISHVVTTTKN